jgi:hypothetical protein
MAQFVSRQRNPIGAKGGAQSPWARPAWPTVAWPTTAWPTTAWPSARVGRPSVGLGGKPLAVSRASDPAEREADTLADRIVRGGSVGRVSAATTTPGIARKCDACEQEEGGDAAIMRSPAVAGAAGDRPSASLATSDAVKRAAAVGGVGLPQSFRGEMEGAFGRSLSDVRLHADSEAAQLSRDLHAQAFTHGNHIFFGAGRLDTASGPGRRLIAHELVHVLQDRGGEGGIHRQGADGASHATVGEPNAAAAAGVPFEKWSEEIERQYRLRGDDARAGAVHNCRTRAGAACDALLTTNQMFALYALGKESKGDQDKVLAGLPAIDVGLAAAASAAAKRAPLRLVPNPPPEAVPNPLPGLGAAEVIPGVALVALLTAEVFALMSLAKFQAELAKQGFVVLESPEGLCHGGCHIAPREESKSPFGGLTFPDLDRDTIDQFFGQKPTPATVPETGSGTEAQPVPDAEPKRGPGGRWGCDDVRCNVYPDMTVKPPKKDCPPRVIGASRGYPDFASACLAAQQDANRKVPRGCIKRHCNCATKCRPM